MNPPLRCAIARIEASAPGPDTALYDDPNHPGVILRHIRAHCGDQILAGLVPLCELHADPEYVEIDDFVSRRWIS
jgi:hypothetical protein